VQKLFGQGCQMVSFQTKNPNLGKYWRALDGKMMVYLMAIWNILRTFEVCYDHLVHIVFSWYIFSGFGIMYQRKIWQPCFWDGGCAESNKLEKMMNFGGFLVRFKIESMQIVNFNTSRH
jgi:hypothetical protein